MTKMKSVLLAMVLSSVTTMVSAAEPLYVVKSVELNQSADVVWKKVADFSDLGAWHPAVAKTEIVSGKSDHAGAKRVLTLQDGGKINETLTAYNQNAKAYSYKITDGVLPVSGYASTITVHTNGVGKSVVVWESHFLPKSPADEKTASDTIKGVYDGGLEQLKKIFP